MKSTLGELVKETKEMETQTDLTTEQISQMEQDLTNARKRSNELLYEKNKLEYEMTDISKQIDRQREEVDKLQGQIKETPNETEKQLLTYLKLEEYQLDQKIKEELTTGQTETKKWDWTQLRED